MSGQEEVPPPARRVTAHVLDVGRGVPAAGLHLAIARVDGGRREALGETVTNSDGRTDVPLLDATAMRAGIYEVTYALGDYFARTVPDSGTFFAEVPVQFRISDSDVHIHVALLASPWSYTTYRGS